MPKTPSPFDVSLTDEQGAFLGRWASQEIQNAQAAKATLDSDIDEWHKLYEQAKRRRVAPWPDAADLTSYIPTEKVDAIHARLMRTVWVTPMWTVEGWGQSADRAPFVEEFHQWKAEEERLQSVLDRLSLTALIETRALLEVSESSERTIVRRERKVKPRVHEAGGLMFDERGQPLLERDSQGDYIDVDGNGSVEEPSVTIVSDESTLVRTGPQYRVIPYRDSIILPGAARDEQEIYGYGKRCWIRLVDIKRRAALGVYSAAVVDRLTETSDRDNEPALQRSLQTVGVDQDRQTASKELWELLIKLDLGDLCDTYRVPRVRGVGDGLRWYVLTIHLGQQLLLRMQHDDINRSRYVPIILYPRPDRVTEGFSFIGHKLITVIEEHTAYRNMAADRSAMAVSAPIKKLTGALWDEDEQPWGPKAVITVKDHREIEPVQVPDVPQSVFEQIAYQDRTAERIAGVNDIAAGQVAQESRTLGEVQMATEQSFVRMDLIVRRFQEKMEDLAQIRHAIWKRALAERPEGIEPPQSLVAGLEGRGVSIDRYLPNGRITAALLEGAFRFKPYGSVETANVSKQQVDLTRAIQSLGMLLTAFPMLAPMFQTPQAARAMGRYWLKVFRVPSPQSFLGSPAQDLTQQLALQQLPIPSLAPPPQFPGMAAGMTGATNQFTTGAPPMGQAENIEPPDTSGGY